MQGLSTTIMKIGKPALEISVGGTFVWFGTLLLWGTTPLLPFFQAAYPRFDKDVIMPGLGAVELLLGVLILLPIVLPFLTKSLRVLGMAATAALVVEMGYLTLLVVVLFSAEANIFSPFIPHVTTFGYFVLHKMLAVLAALVLTAMRVEAKGTQAGT